MRIGVIIAMEKELLQLKGLMEDAEEKTVKGRHFHCGTIGCNEVVMLQSGIGKVNAALGAQALIDNFAPECVVSTGVAGGASIDLEVMDVVVSTETAYHDAYCGSEMAYGQIMGLPERFASSAELVDKARSLDCGVNIVPGLTVTGDWFVDSQDKMREILGHFPEAAAVDMESAAIAHTCHLNGIPFVSFRIISDIPLKDNKAAMYFDFWATVREKSFAVTAAFLGK